MHTLPARPSASVPLCSFALTLIGTFVGPALPAQAPATPAPPTVAPQDLATAFARSVGREAMGLYLGDKRIGFEIRDLQLVDTPDGKRLRVESECVVRMRSFGSETVARTKTTTLYSLEGDGPMTAFTSVEVKDGVRTVVRAKMQGGKLAVTTRAGGTTTTRTIDLPRERLREWLDGEAWLQAGPTEGARFELYRTDLNVADHDRRDVMIYRGKKATEVDGVAATVHSLQLVTDGMNLEVEALDWRRFLRMKVGGLMESRREPEEKARDLDASPPDLGDMTTVRVATDMGETAAALDEVVLRVEGLQGLDIPSDHRQGIDPRADGAVMIHLRREGRTAAATPLTDAQREQYLRAEPGIECGHARIRTRAQEIVGAVTDPVAKAALLQRWVFETLEAKYDANASSALVILEKRSGDCTEHARLFVALARAVGVPAREVTGLLYGDRDGPAFL